MAIWIKPGDTLKIRTKGGNVFTLNALEEIITDPQKQEKAMIIEIWFDNEFVKTGAFVESISAKLIMRGKRFYLRLIEVKLDEKNLQYRLSKEKNEKKEEIYNAFWIKSRDLVENIILKK